MSFKDYVYYCLVSLFCLTTFHTSAQDQKVADSLARIYHRNNLPDTTKLELLKQLSFNEMNNYNSSLQYAEDLIALSQKLGNNNYLFHGYFQKGNKERILGNYREALDAFFKSAEVAKKSDNVSREGIAFGSIADVYSLTDNYENAMLYHRKAIATLQQSSDSTTLAKAILNTGEAFRTFKVYDSALYYFQASEKIFDKKDDTVGKAYSLGNIGMVYLSLGKNDLAENNLNAAIKFLEVTKDYYPVCVYLISLSDIYVQKGDAQTALEYAQKSLAMAQQYNLKEQIRDADLKLSQLYDSAHNVAQAFKYYKGYIQYQSDIDNITAVKKMADLRTNFEVAQKQQEVNLLRRQKNQQKILLFLALAVLAVIIVLIIKLQKNYRQKKIAYTLLSKEKDISEQRRDETNRAMQELKRTQAHLIHSEKMASLGELTAGIAHEIQNPLNFINNFSEVNTELIAELLEENKHANVDAVKAIGEDILSNAGKIGYHGRRVDAIVKGMLEHGRSGVPEKRPTDINALADEYFRLAYLGLRAKDKSFNATMKTDFDPDVGKINIMPQEIGRVILNLVTNAFHAVWKKSKEIQNDYTPTVTVSTQKTGDQLLLCIKDNGTGISPAVQQKIFQPFFTTKAPGFGTGLGLSISYDILKAHGGEIKVKSEEGTGSEFLVILPLDTSDS